MTNYEYRKLLKDVLARTQDHETEMRRIDGVQYYIDLSEGFIPVVGARQFPAHVALAETAWQLMGHETTEWLDKFAPWMWSGVDRGPGGELTAAYGVRWRGQIDCLIRRLRAEPTTRRAQLVTWKAEDLFCRTPQPPCCMIIGFRIRDRGLYTTVHMRGQDIILGLPWNVLNFSILTVVLARELGVCAMGVRFMTAEIHLYPQHEQGARFLLMAPHVGTPRFYLPRTATLEALSDPDTADQEVGALRVSAPGMPVMEWLPKVKFRPPGWSA